MSFDSPLCPPNATGDCRVGATVIYLRQISKPIAFSSRAIASYGAEGYSNSMMTLITTRPDGSNRKLYQFELRYLNGSTAIRTIQITSNAPWFPPIARTVQSSSQSQIQRIRSGLAIATARNLILPDSAIRKPLKQFFQLIDSGSSFENAITQSEIPPEFLDWLQTLMP